MSFKALKALTVARSALSILLAGLSTAAAAHVPYLERRDFTLQDPFVVPYTIEQSIAVYAWLQQEPDGSSFDADVYRFEIKEPTRIYVELLVPVCSQYTEFVPWFALIGPGLPASGLDVPFALPPGYGAVVVENVPPGTPRDQFYEPFGAKAYFEGPVFDETVSEPGTYFVAFWDPYRQGGDYVAVLGAEEIWRPEDILRALFVTPAIRADKELHVSCEAP